MSLDSRPRSRFGLVLFLDNSEVSKLAPLHMGPALIRDSFDAAYEVRKTPPADRRAFRDQIHFALQWKAL